ncbi:hypothetical protein BDP55DRAFT_661066 [Colletotrichum godetiae]|uniref:Uncharacterized protein n=1 Tax=Colletotrichum godetiae TaxID=1209918 RepID=A0AAJ0AR26_9PEZI|nr:uncharacterized protein BDP55DRAFT_661066 [Colletotrichum godetiae]KAK1676937.1 hypothetical protein BDP55DRAFT_661066 [Colletotrichum godetiae]
MAAQDLIRRRGKCAWGPRRHSRSILIQPLMVMGSTAVRSMVSRSSFGSWVKMVNVGSAGFGSGRTGSLFSRSSSDEEESTKMHTLPPSRTRPGCLRWHRMCFRASKTTSDHLSRLGVSTKISSSSLISGSSASSSVNNTSSSDCPLSEALPSREPVDADGMKCAIARRTRVSFRGGGLLTKVLNSSSRSFGADERDDFWKWLRDTFFLRFT